MGEKRERGNEWKETANGGEERAGQRMEGDCEWGRIREEIEKAGWM